MVLAFAYRVVISVHKYREAKVTILLETRHYSRLTMLRNDRNVDTFAWCRLAIPSVTFCMKPDVDYYDGAEDGESFWEWQRRLAEEIPVEKIFTMEIREVNDTTIKGAAPRYINIKCNYRKCKYA